MSNDNINSIKSLIKELTDKFKSSGIKKFPDDFLFITDLIEENIPNKILVYGCELFGNFEINTCDGELFKLVDDLMLAKYYIYSSTQRRDTIKIPSNKSEIKTIVTEYEHYFDNLLKTIRSEIPNSFSIIDKFEISNQIITNLNLTRF